MDTVTVSVIIRTRRSNVINAGNLGGGHRTLTHHMENNLLHTIRETLNQELVLGSERFKDRIETTLKRRARPGQPGRPRAEGVEEEAAEYGVY